MINSISGRTNVNGTLLDHLHLQEKKIMDEKRQRATAGDFGRLDGAALLRTWVNTTLEHGIKLKLTQENKHQKVLKNYRSLEPLG